MVFGSADRGLTCFRLFGLRTSSLVSRRIESVVLVEEVETIQIVDRRQDAVVSVPKRAEPANTVAAAASRGPAL